jgi:UDP-N-acetylmuramate dehydrogenase
LINKYAFTSFISQLNAIIPGERLLIDEPMSRHTTFAVGGPADVLVLPHTVQELAVAIRSAKELLLPLTVLGGGSNVLVLDGGIRGVVIQLNELNKVLQCDGLLLRASSGLMLGDVCAFAQQNGLAGIEFACGIPGTLGGAVFMNAGAYDGEMSEVVSRVQAINDAGIVHTYDAVELKFSYRHSIFQLTQEVIVEVELALTADDKAAIAERIDVLMNRRRSKQPLEMHSAGSTFKRPSGYFAGTLIEQTGLKGFSVGDAQVSTKHAGFVVNIGHASAEDILCLIREIQKRVESAHGVCLEPEVRIIGEPRK